MHVSELAFLPGETSHAITLTNPSVASVAFTVQTFAPLSVTPSSGSIPPGQTVSLMVAVDNGGALVGNRASALIINAGGSQITVTVTVA